MRVREFVENFRKRNNRAPRVGFFGFGVTNRALYKAHLAEGVTDFTLRAHSEEDYIPFARSYFGESSVRELDEDILFLSPSVRRDACGAVREAERLGIRVCSDCELYFETPTPPTLCVTGSDGKSTVTAMTAHILRTAGIAASPAGNFGIPFCELSPKTEICVAELSSFNLSYSEPRSCRAAITNITENHLNWHASFEEYCEAKARVLERTEGTVLSADDPICLSLARGSKPFALYSAELSYGELSRLAAAEHYLTQSDGYILLDGARYAPLPDATARVRHTLLNAMTAAGLTLGYADSEQLGEALRSFKHLSHRAELCHSHSGIDFIDSSIDTTPGRTANTLRGLCRPVLLLLGGRGKGLSYEPLTEPLASYARAVALYGEAGREIEAYLCSHGELDGIARVYFRDFDTALAALCEQARKGDTVLLSPAATAYGEFRNFAERGCHFASYVKNKFT